MSSKVCFRARKQRGNILFLSIAFATFIAFAIAIFVLGYTRIVGSHQEVLKATEAAAMTAARSFSQIVIDDPNFGLIGISDSAPIGAHTSSLDGYGSPTTGINTLIATVRLDMILADQIDNSTLMALAVRDYENLMRARQNLTTELNRLTRAGESGVDKNGNAVSPYNDALRSYNSNQIRMTGESNSLVPGSFTITLGLINNLPTNTNIPKPTTYSAMSENDQESEKYLAYRNIPYNNRDFVFAGIGHSTALVDHKQFQVTDSNLPYFVPAVVQIELEQQFSGSTLTGKRQERVHKSKACARPGALEESHPFPGGLVFIFDSGPISDLSSPSSILFSQQLSTSPVDFFQTVDGADFPTRTPVSLNHPITGDSHPDVSEVFSLAIYDWLKRAGSRANVESVRDFLTTSFRPASGDDIHSFQWRPDGTIDYTIEAGNRSVFLPISDKQWKAVSGLAWSTSEEPTTGNENVFDCYITDYVNKPGRMNGGRHCGQPLNLSAINSPVLYDTGVVGTNTLYATRLFARFPTGPGNGAIRPSYRERNIAVSIRFHYRN